MMAEATVTTGKRNANQDSLTAVDATTSGVYYHRICCLVEHDTMYWVSLIMLASVMSITHFIPLPILVQMVAYTAPIIYLGSHLGLQQKDVMNK